MTPNQRRAHLILHGQTLLDEWRQRCKLWDEGSERFAEGVKLWDEGEELQTEGDKLRAKGRKLWAKGSKLYDEGRKLWADAVLKEFGPGCTVAWDGDTCTLSVGEGYLPVNF